LSFTQSLADSTPAFLPIAVESLARLGSVRGVRQLIDQIENGGEYLVNEPMKRIRHDFAFRNAGRLRLVGVKGKRETPRAGSGRAVSIALFYTHG